MELLMSKYKPSKHEWGTDASTKRAKELTPNESSKDGKIASGSKVVNSQKRNSIKEKVMPLSAKDPIAKWIEDFKKSDAPQFKDKSGEDRKAMAIAAYMDAKKGRDQVEGVSESLSRVDIEGLGPVFVDGSPARVKNDLRKMFKKPDYVKNVERATPSDAKKYFRGMAAGKVEEGVNEGECWDTHKKVGTKMKNGKRVNDCVPKNEDSQQTDTDLHTNASAKKPQNFKDKDGKTKVRMVPAHQDVEKESVDEFLMVKKNPMRNSNSSSSSSSSSSRSSGRKGAAGTTSGQSVTTTSGNGYKVSRNIKTGKTSKSRYNVGGSATQKESMDPRDHTDKAGHLVVVTKPGGKKMIKHYHPTSSGAQKYADRVNKTNRVGHKATVHKTDGRRIMEEVSAPTKLGRLSKMGSEAISEATSQVLSNKKKELSSKMFGNVRYLNPAQRKELDKAAKAAVKADREAKKAASKKQSTTKTSTGKKHMGSMEAGDRNIVMQLRKAQDLKGNHDIIVSPKGRTARLPKAMIDKLLNKFNSLQKPQEKRKFQIMVTKELRKRAK